MTIICRGRGDRGGNLRIYGGGRAGQYSLPKFISKCEKSIHFSLGTICIKSCSIFTGSLDWVKPNFWERRMTCVSTTIPSALWNALPKTTLAVLRATPGRASSSSIAWGTSPWYFSTNTLQAAWIFLALLLWKFILLIVWLSSIGSALAKSWAVWYFLKSSGVTRLTVLSVACAERIVVISNWRGLAWRRAVLGWG